METTSRKEENAFTKMMEGFGGDDDTIYLEAFDEDGNIVAGSPLNSVTGECKIGMTMISSFEEAVNSGYKIATNGKHEGLDKKLTEHFKNHCHNK